MHYQIDLEGIEIEHLAGFFVGWPQPPSLNKHLALLRGSSHVVLAWECRDAPLVGFITAVSDRVLSAHIPFLEVRPEYRGKGVGTELVTRLLAHLGHLYVVDVVCDAHLLPFYQRIGFTAAAGGAIRRSERILVPA